MSKHFFMSVFCLFLFFSLTVDYLQGQSPSIQRVAILACHRQNEPSPALAKYIAAKPDLCLWIGDNIYADSKDDIAFIENCYNTLAAKPDFQTLKTSIPYLATWDDHDFGLNDAGKEYNSLRKKTEEVYLKRGLHPLRIHYFDDTFGQKLNLEYTLNGGAAIHLKAADLFTDH